MKHSIEQIVHTVLAQNRIHTIDSRDLELQLQIHPNYPSFHSITDTLDYFNIDNIAVEVPLEALEQMPESFISLIKANGSEEIVAISLKNKKVQLKNTSLKQKYFSIDDFKKIWIPKVIAVEHSSKSASFSRNKWFQPIALLSTLVMLSGVFLFFSNPFSVFQTLFFSLSIIGVVASVFVVRESLGIQSQLVQNFCSTVTNTTCSDVINNPSGKLFGLISIADVSFVFYASITIYQVLYGFNAFLALLVMASVPMVLYAIFSQAFVIKKWCALCLLISAVSLLLAIIAIPIIIGTNTLGTEGIVSFVFLSGIIGVIFSFTKTVLQKNKDLKVHNIKLNQFKRDLQVFNHFFSTSETVMYATPIQSEIILGNPEASFKIVCSTNPKCGFCKDAFGAYVKAYKGLKDKLQIVIRFNVRFQDIEDEATQISLRLMEIFHQEGATSFIEAYQYWFENKSFIVWSKKYSKPENKQEYLTVLQKQHAWIEENKLMYTPATVINSKVYPQKYGYDEFFYFVNMILENYNNQENTAVMEENLQEEMP